MKEYDTFTLEELRCADYMANRKGPGTGTTAPANTGATGLFGAAPNQTAPATGGLFGSTAATTQQSTLFGANQQNKPLFGATGGTTGGFGQPTSAFGQTNSAFSTPNTATSGGIFGAKPATGFGAAATTASSGFGFGGQTNTATNMFGQNQQNTGFGNKPFGAAQPQTSQPLFGASTGGFGTTAAAPAFGTTGTTGGFGQPQQQQNSSIGLFGQQNQAKPAFGFGAAGASSFGSTATTNTGAAFSFGQTTNTFGAQQQNQRLSDKRPQLVLVQPPVDSELILLVQRNQPKITCSDQPRLNPLSVQRAQVSEPPVDPLLEVLEPVLVEPPVLLDQLEQRVVCLGATKRGKSHCSEDQLALVAVQPVLVAALQVELSMLVVPISPLTLSSRKTSNRTNRHLRFRSKANWQA